MTHPAPAPCASTALSESASTALSENDEDVCPSLLCPPFPERRRFPPEKSIHCVHPEIPTGTFSQPPPPPGKGQLSHSQRAKVIFPPAVGELSERALLSHFFESAPFIPEPTGRQPPPPPSTSRGCPPQKAHTYVHLEVPTHSSLFAPPPPPACQKGHLPHSTLYVPRRTWRCAARSASTVMVGRLRMRWATRCRCWLLVHQSRGKPRPGR